MEYLRCEYIQEGMFPGEFILRFYDSNGRSVEGFFSESHTLDGANQKEKLVCLSCCSKRSGGLVTIVLPNDGTFGEGGRSQGGFIQVKPSQIVYK